MPRERPKKWQKDKKKKKATRTKQAGCMRYALGHSVKGKMRPAFKFSETMILRTKNRSLRDR